MLIQILLAREALIAHGALERFLTTMHFKVPLEIALHCKGPATFRALERLFATVHAEMVPQSRLVLVYFATQ